SIVLDEAPGGFFGVELEIVLAEDIFRRFSKEPRGRRVHEHVASIEVLDEDGVRRRLDHRPEDLIAVGQRHPTSHYPRWRGPLPGSVRSLAASSRLPRFAGLPPNELGMNEYPSMAASIRTSETERTPSIGRHVYFSGGNASARPMNLPRITSRSLRNDALSS